MAKIHIHTNDPEQTLAIAATYGKLLSQKIDDMSCQTASVPLESAESILVCCKEEDSIPLFTSLGAVVLATKNGPCLEASAIHAYLQQPFSLLSSLSPEELEQLFPGLTTGPISISYQDDDLSLAELLLV